MSEHSINSFMGVSMEKIRNMVDTNTMMGDPITCEDGTTIIPVSKVSVGFASGGSDLPTRTGKEYFAGGAGGGVSVKPIGFLILHGGEVELKQLTMGADKVNVFLEMLPGLIDKLREGKKDGKNKEKPSKTAKPSAAPPAPEPQPAESKSAEPAPVVSESKPAEPSPAEVKPAQPSAASTEV